MADVWNVQDSRVPTSIGEIGIALYNVDGQVANHMAKYNVKVLDQNGEVLKQLNGDLKPHLTTEQTTTIVNFLADMRTKVETQIIPD